MAKKTNRELVNDEISRLQREGVGSREIVIALANNKDSRISKPIKALLNKDEGKEDPLAYAGAYFGLRVNPKPKGFMGRSAEKISNFTDAMTDNLDSVSGIAENMVASADTVTSLAGGMVDMPLEGLTGLMAMGMGDNYDDGKNFYRDSKLGGLMTKVATPKTELGGKAMETMGVIDDGIKTVGNAVYETTGSPLLATGTEVAGNFLPVGRLKGRAKSGRAEQGIAEPEISAKPAQTSKPKDTASTLPSVGKVDTPNMEASNMEMYGLPSVGKVEPSNIDIKQPAVNNADYAQTNNAKNQKAPQNSQISDNIMNDTIADIDHLLNLNRSKPKTGGVAPDVQGLRAKTLHDIGFEDGQVRKGAITGDIQQLETEKSLSKLDNEAGHKMRSQLEAEYEKMNQYATDIIEKDIGTEANLSPEARGKAVIDAIEGVEQYYKNKVSEAYTMAGEAMEGKGNIPLNQFVAQLKNDSVWMGKAPNQQLRRGLIAHLKHVGIIEKGGNIRNVTAKEAEGIRQYINSQYSYETKGLIGHINSKIDADVIEVLPENALVEARNLHKQYKQLFHNPKGIAQLIESDGINRKVTPEQAGKKLQSLAISDGKQFNHIYNMLDNLPPELQAHGKRAKAEIQATIAENIFEKGGLQTVNKEYMKYRKSRKDGSHKALDIFGEGVTKKLDNYVAGRNILQHQDPNPSGTATTAKNLNEIGGLSSALLDITTGTPGASVARSAIGSKLKGRLQDKQSQKAFDESMNAEQTRAYRNSREQVVNGVINLDDMGKLLNEIEKPKASQNKVKVKALQQRIYGTKEWRNYLKTLPKQTAINMAKNADVLVLLTQGANQHEKIKNQF